jgi:hypothetical protein
MSASTLGVRFLHSISDVDAAQWNALAGSDYPFMRHEFLLALEHSGCTTARSGWEPLHALVERSPEPEPGLRIQRKGLDRGFAGLDRCFNIAITQTISHLLDRAGENDLRARRRGTRAQRQSQPKQGRRTTHMHTPSVGREV